jgi:hypothetical protein
MEHCCVVYSFYAVMFAPICPAHPSSACFDVGNEVDVKLDIFCPITSYKFEVRINFCVLPAFYNCRLSLVMQCRYSPTSEVFNKGLNNFKVVSPENNTQPSPFNMIGRHKDY